MKKLFGLIVIIAAAVLVSVAGSHEARADHGDTDVEHVSLKVQNLTATRDSNGDVVLEWDWPTGCVTYYPITVDGEVVFTWEEHGCRGKQVEIWREVARADGSRKNGPNRMPTRILAKNGKFTTFTDVGAYTWQNYWYRVKLTDLDTLPDDASTNTDPADDVHAARVGADLWDQEFVTSAPTGLRVKERNYKFYWNWGKATVQWDSVHDAPAYAITLFVVTGKVRYDGKVVDASDSGGITTILPARIDAVDGLMMRPPTSLTFDVQADAHEGFGEVIVTVFTCAPGCNAGNYLVDEEGEQVEVLPASLTVRLQGR